MAERTAPVSKLHKAIHLELPARVDTPPLPGMPTLAEISAIIAQWEMDDAIFLRSLDAGDLPTVALGRLGVRLCLAGRNSDAASVLSAAVSLSPDDISLLNNLAVARTRCEEVWRVIPLVERSLVLSPVQADSWILLGNLKKMQGDLAGAQKAYETALEIKPHWALAWQELGVVRKNQREYHIAIECFLNCIKHGQMTPEILSILGQLFFLTGQFQKSRDAYQLASDGDPASILYRKMLGEMKFACLAIDNLDLDAVIDPLLPVEADELLHKTFAMLSAYGQVDAAHLIAQQRFKRFPDNPTAAYLLRAIRGDSNVERSPDDFLIQTFDRVADRFDDHLVNGLGYDIPRKLTEAVARLIPDGLMLDVLDVGCGTGLCGPLVRPFARSLTGLDLSPKMLAQAQRRNIYDRVICSEITAFLQNSTDSWDVILAADVLIYFGDLLILKAGFAKALRFGGLLAISIERSTAANHPLLACGRFAHTVDYIRSVFQADFDECLFRETTVRHEANQPVPGNIFVFRKRPTQSSCY